MTLKEYIDNLKALVNNHPEALDYKVVIANDESNGFSEVYFKPSLGNYDEINFIEIDLDLDKPLEINAVCVN